jgi:hypothetical protein
MKSGDSGLKSGVLVAAWTCSFIVTSDRLPYHNERAALPGDSQRAIPGYFQLDTLLYRVAF